MDVTNLAFNEPSDGDQLKLKYREPYDRLLAAVQAGEMTVLCAVRGSEIIGSVRYRVLDDDTLRLEKLAVPEPYRSHQVGRNLMRAVETRALEMGYRTITLECMQEKGLALYYQRLGYEIESIQSHQGHHDVEMRKILTVADVNAASGFRK